MLDAHEEMMEKARKGKDNYVAITRTRETAVLREGEELYEFQIKEAELKAEFLELKERMISAQKVVRESPDKQEESLIGNIAEVQTVNQEKEAPIKDTAQITAAGESYSQEKKISCGHCGKENKVGAKFCKFCGYQLVEEKVRFCTECGNKIKPGKKFCSACGAKVED